MGSVILYIVSYSLAKMIGIYPYCGHINLRLETVVQVCFKEYWPNILSGSENLRGIYHNIRFAFSLQWH